MALIICLDCNTEMSPLAEMCPQCGRISSRKGGFLIGRGVLFILLLLMLLLS